MPDKKRVTSGERDAILRLHAAVDILATSGNLLSKRYGAESREKLGGAIKTVVDIWKEIVETIPEQQRKSIQRDIDGISYSVGVRRPAAEAGYDRDFGMWVSIETLYQLIGGCHERCMLCEDDLQKRRGCALRQALDNVANNTEELENGDCPYFWLVKKEG